MLRAIMQKCLACKYLSCFVYVWGLCFSAFARMPSHSAFVGSSWTLAARLLHPSSNWIRMVDAEVANNQVQTVRAAGQQQLRSKSLQERRRAKVKQINEQD